MDYLQYVDGGLKPIGIKFEAHSELYFRILRECLIRMDFDHITKCYEISNPWDIQFVGYFNQDGKLKGYRDYTGTEVKAIPFDDLKDIHLVDRNRAKSNLVGFLYGYHNLIF